MNSTTSTPWVTYPVESPFFRKKRRTLSTSSAAYALAPVINTATMVDMNTTISAATSYGNDDITPGWWSDRMTPEDLEISMLPKEKVLAEARALAGSWAEREDLETLINASRKSCDDRLKQLYGDELSRNLSV